MLMYQTVLFYAVSHSKHSESEDIVIERSFVVY